MSAASLRVIPLGGLGEVGRNALVLEYEERLIVIDAGLMFPENDMLGVDILIPDLGYVFERADRVAAVIVTHGHEDHVGALPYLLDKVKAPVYATRLTRGLVESKLREARVNGVSMHTISPADTLDITPFRIEFFHVSHSIPDGVGLAIQTPLGLVVHSGDFKFDHNPADGICTDRAKLEDYGRRGVLLLLSDSVNAERTGHTPSEETVGEMLSDIFAEAEGRIIVATFASNISRVQQVVEAARHVGRKVAIAGRSMVNNVRIARELGFLHIDNDVLIPLEQISQHPNSRIVLICTGSQGEPTSALVRLGTGDFRSAKIVPGDTVIVSATPIPGNEELINRTLDNLFRLGADVLYDKVLNVHVSGHGSQEEQKMMIELIRPQYFVPIHGEYRHLVLHSRLAGQCGVDPARIFVMETGDVLEITSEGAAVVDRVADSDIFVDGHRVGDVVPSVIEDRRRLARSGFVVGVVALDKYTGSLIGEPQLHTHGFVYEVEEEHLLAGMKQEAAKAIQAGGTRSELVERLRNSLARFALEETGRRPIVVPVVVKV